MLGRKLLKLVFKTVYCSILQCHLTNSHLIHIARQSTLRDSDMVNDWTYCSHKHRDNCIPQRVLPHHNEHSGDLVLDTSKLNAIVSE